MQQNDGRLVSSFIVQALRDKDITIYGDGSQTRSFCYVDDLIEGLVAMMENPTGEIGPVNLGNPEEFAIHGLVQRIISLTGSSSQTSCEPLPEDDPQRRMLDIGKARSLLNWQPTTPTEEGLEKTIAYFRTLV